MATITLPNGAKITLPGEKAPPKDVDLLDETKRVLSSVNEDYLAGAVGFPVDAVNWLLGGVGLDSERPVMGSDWLRDQMRDVGASQEGYRPQTQIGKYAAAGLGGLGAGAAGGAITGGGLMALGKAIGSPATVAAGRASITPALDAAAGAGASIGGQAAEDIAPGDMTAQVAGQFLGALTPGAVAGLGKVAGNQIVKAMDNLGIDPTMGTAGVGGRTAAYVQNNVLDHLGGGQNVVRNALDQTLAQTDDATRRIAEAYGQPMAGQYGAGAQLQKDLTDWFDRVKLGTGKVYDDIGKQFAPDETFAATKTLDALRNPAGKVDSAALAKEISDPQITKFLAALESSDGNLSYNDLKLFRSHVGSLLDPRMAGNIDQNQLKTLYGALSDDMAEAVASKGADVLHRWRTTNAFYANAMSRFKDQFERLVGKGGIVPPERAYGLLVSSAEKDFDRFKSIWDVLTPEQRGDYAATILTEMGRGKEGELSVAKFLTEYGKMSGQARALLFRSTGNGEAEAALDDLLTVIRGLDKNANKVMSTSRSNVALPMLAQGGAAGAALQAGQPMAALTALVGPWALAKIMTNPTATKSLAFALKALKAGGAAAAKATAIFQAFGLPDAQGQ